MDLSDLEERAEAELSFPADAATVRETLGDEELSVSGVDGSARLGDVIDRTEMESFESARALAETVQANVDESLVGREDYTDRGTGTVDTDEI